jgi:hypothetical protein
MSKAPYERKREKADALTRAFRKMLEQTGGKMSVMELIERLEELPAPRFYVSTQCAINMVNRIKKGVATNMRGKRREMFEEIMARLETEKRKHPQKSNYDQMEDVLAQPAPSFYMTGKSMYKIINSHLKENRRRRLNRT